MKSLILLSALTSILFTTSFTQAAQDVEDNFGGRYTTYDEAFLPEKSTVEALTDKLGFSLPFYEGPQERAQAADNATKKQYCRKHAREACRVVPESADATGDLRMDALNCRLLPEAPMGTYDGGACPRACLAWTDDCRDLISEKELRRIFADDL